MKDKDKPLYPDPYPSFGDFDREALRRLIRMIDKPYRRFLEIGSWLGGGSTQVFIQEIADGSGELYCVDTWEGSENVEVHRKIARDYDVFATFQANVSRSGGDARVEPLRMSSRRALSEFTDGSLDLVFIDGDHSYDQTMADIRGWHPKVAPGGILCGHDCELRLTKENRPRFLSRRDLESIQGEGNFLHCHPGVIIAVNEHFGDELHLWAEEEIVLADGQRGPASIWEVKIK